MSDNSSRISESDPLATLVRSPHVVALLRALYLPGSGKPQSLSELSRGTGVPVTTVHREVERWERAGLVVTHTIGRSRVVEPNVASPIHGELVSLVAKAAGPVKALAEAFNLPGVSSAWLFGSWARVVMGEALAGAPGDVDVLLIGNPAMDDVYAAARRAESHLGQAVDTLVVTQCEWEEADGSLKTIASRPMVLLLGDEA